MWIDHAIVSSPDLVVKHGQVSALGFSCHDLIFVTYKIKPRKRFSEITVMRNIARQNLDKLAQNACYLNWSGVMAAPTVDDKLVNFCTTLLSFYDKHASIRSVILKRPPAPWITALVRITMRRRDRAFRKFRRCRSEENWATLKSYRNRCNQKARALKHRYFQDNLLNSSPEDTWKFFKSIGLVKSQNAKMLFLILTLWTT